MIAKLRVLNNFGLKVSCYKMKWYMYAHVKNSKLDKYRYMYFTQKMILD